MFNTATIYTKHFLWFVDNRKESNGKSLQCLMTMRQHNGIIEQVLLERAFPTLTTAVQERIHGTIDSNHHKLIYGTIQK